MSKSLLALRNCFLAALAVPVLIALVLGIGYVGLRLFGPDAASSDRYELRMVIDGLTQPSGITIAGDERLFIVERQGTIRIIEDGALVDDPFLDITDIVNDESHVEQGLLGLAFDPDYAENGFFYVYYTDFAPATIVARYQVEDGDPSHADPESGEVIVEVPQPGVAHNGGHIAFGPDGYLYVGLGDGTDAGDESGTGLRLNDLYGKILRLDVSNGLPYAIPEDNPFVDDADARPEIWVLGLRNPWSFSFDSETGDLYIGDVGQGAYEEVNFQAADSPGGENYGWSLYEGPDIFNPDAANNPDIPKEELVFSVAGYERNWLSPSEVVAEGYYRCAVIGGVVYHGEALPDLDGAYLYADWCSGLIWTLTHSEDEWQVEEFTDTDLTISAFGVDIDGEIYVADFGGAILKLVEKDGA